MQQHPKMTAVAALLALIGAADGYAAEGDAPLMDVVVVSATRVGHASFDMPAAIEMKTPPR